MMRGRNLIPTNQQYNAIRAVIAFARKNVRNALSDVVHIIEQKIADATTYLDELITAAKSR